MVFSIVPLPVMHVAELSWRDQPVIRAPALPVPISTVLFQLSSLNCAVQFLPRGKSCLIQERISAFLFMALSRTERLSCCSRLAVGASVKQPKVRFCTSDALLTPVARRESVFL